MHSSIGSQKALSQVDDAFMELRVLYDVLKRDDRSDVVLQDCETAFNCRNIASKNQNYSVGATYFIRSNELATCNLESLAHQIFCHHTRGLSFDPSRSGAEWWTQVIDHRDDIGFHWDRDYGSEEETGVHIHPLFGTVTYLSNNGGPTLILDKTGTPDASVPIVGTVSKFAASKPLFGKSIAFGGSLLHAAPSSLTEEDSESDSDDGSSEHSGDDASEEEEEGAVKRVTFLVNIWIDHIPTQCIRFPKKEVKKMQPLIVDLKLDFNGAAPEQSKVSAVLTADNCAVTRKWKFNNSDINYEVLVPFPDLPVTEKLMNDHDMLYFEYTAPTTGAAAASKCIEIVYSEDQPSDGSGDGSDGASEVDGNSQGEDDSEGESVDSESAEVSVEEEGGPSDAENSGGEDSLPQAVAKKRRL